MASVIASNIADGFIAIKIRSHVLSTTYHRVHCSTHHQRLVAILVDSALPMHAGLMM